MAKLTGQGTINFDAYFAFQQGQALLANWRVSDMQAAIEQLSRAIEIDPRFPKRTSRSQVLRCCRPNSK